MNPESLHSASLNGALHPFAGLPGETTSLPKTPCHQLTQCEYSEEPRGAGKRGREEWVSVLILPPPSPISLLGAGSPAVNSRPPSPCLPSTPAAPVAPADPGAQGGRGTWAPGPRRGGQAAAPRTVAAPNPKHTRTHTRARAGQSVCPEESEGASPALHSFPQRRRSRLPGASTPRSWGLQRSQLRHDPPPIRPQPPSPLHPHTQPSRLALHHDRQRRPRAGPLPPRLPTASPPRSPRSPAAAPLRPAAPGSPRPGRPGTPPPPPRSASYSKVTPPLELRPGAARGQWAEGGQEGGEGGEQKFRRLGPRRAPVSSQARPRAPTPGNRSLRLCHLGPPPQFPPPPRSPPSSGGTEAGAGRRLGARVGESGGCTPTCPRRRLETSPKCAGQQSAWLGNPPHPPPYPRSHGESTELWVRLSSACSAPPGFRLLGLFSCSAGSCVPRGVRPPPASRGPQRHRPTIGSPVPELRPHSPESRRGACEPWRRRCRRAALPAGSPARGAPGARAAPAARGRPPLGAEVASGRLGRGSRGPNLPRLRALPSSLSAWAAAAATAPGAPRGVRLREASAGPDSLRPARAAPGAAWPERGGAPEPDTHPRRLSPPGHPTCT